MQRIVFAYHAVSDEWEPSATTVAARRFREHCAVLAAEGWVAVPLREAFDDPRERVFVLTVDDAYECLERVVVPECERHGWRGTAFVAAGLVGGDGTWDVGAWKKHPHAGWESLARMIEAGWEIGGHGVRHRAVPDLRTDLAQRELAQSREIIETRLGTIVSSFAWPFGAVNQAVARLAREAGYLRGATMFPGTYTQGTDPMYVPRWPVYRMDRARNLLVRLEGPAWTRTLESARVRTIQQFARGTRVRMAGTR